MSSNRLDANCSLLIKIRQRAPLLTFASFYLVIAACGQSPEAHRVTPEAARRTLDAVLESWQQGRAPEEWQSREPHVVIQDFDWMSGAKLLDFEVLETTPIDANLHCQVKLLLSTDKGRNARTVTYLVGTSPVLTVFREPGP